MRKFFDATRGNKNLLASLGGMHPGTQDKKYFYNYLSAPAESAICIPPQNPLRQEEVLSNGTTNLPPARSKDFSSDKFGRFRFSGDTKRKTKRGKA